MTPTRTLSLALALFLAAPLLAAPSALGASASSRLEYSDRGSFQHIVFVAGASEPNRLTATSTQAALRLEDPIGITPLEGCLPASPGDRTIVNCRVGASPSETVFEAQLGDRGDSLLADVRVLARGGDGADVLRATGLLFGDSGDDTLAGRSSEGVVGDSLDGGAGRDRLTGGAGDDDLAGRSGVDFLRGGTGDDDLTGGSGRDVLSGGRGFDQLSGGTGPNRVHARDGHPDRVSCRGADRVKLDRLDMLAGRCGRVVRTGAPRAVPVGDLSSSPLAFGVSSEDGDSLGTGVGCPADRGRPCSGSVVIRDAGRVLARRRFHNILPGRVRQVTRSVGERTVDRAQSGDSLVTLVITTRGPGRSLSATASAEVF